MHRLGQVVTHGPEVGGRHIGRHRLDPGPSPAQAFPEAFQGFDAFAVADEHHGAAVEVEHHGDVAMSLADGDFIDGDLFELVQLGFAEAPLQVAGLDVLDGVPTDLEVVGDVLDGHVTGEFQRV